MKKFLDEVSVLFYNPILVYFFLLLGISLLAIASSYPLSQFQYEFNNNFVMRQLIFFTIGGIALIGVLMLGIERIRMLRWWIYGAVILSLIVLFIDKHLGISMPAVVSTNGATRWFATPVGTIQPSEFMRLALILVTGHIIQEHNTMVPHDRRTARTDFSLILKVMAVILPPAFLIYMQPDSGITILILITAAVMLLAAGVQWRYILSVAALAALIVTLFLLLFKVYPQFLANTLGIEAYRLSRFSGWFDPFGTIAKEGRQLALGLVAIGSGGLIGNGFQSGLIYFPESHTDFIFAIIGKDFGLLGSLVVISLCGLFNFEVLNTAALNRGQYNGLVCAGIFGSLIAQQFWNIGMCLALVPISGVTLPFISHGGSSVLSSMILLGLVLSSYMEGAKLKHSDANYQERILYLKTKAYLKEDTAKPKKLGL